MIENHKQPRSFSLWVDLYEKPNRVEFVVMRTPGPLWDILPQKPQPILEDTQPRHYFKRFTLKHGGKVYELTFYQVVGQT